MAPPSISAGSEGRRSSADRLRPFSCSTLVYLGAIYAGLVAVPVDERTLIASAPLLVEATGAKALWSETGFSTQEPQGLSALCLKGELAQGITSSHAARSALASDLAALMATSGSTRRPALCHGEPWKSDCQY